MNCKLNEIWTLYGDNSYPKRKSKSDEAYSRSSHLLDTRFTSVDVIALDDFDVSHPSSSSLADMCSFTFNKVRVPEWIMDRYSGSANNEIVEVNGNIADRKSNDIAMCETDMGFLLLNFYGKPDTDCRVKVIITDCSGLKLTSKTVVTNY